MSRAQLNAPAQGAAFLTLLLLILPAISLALPVGRPAAPANATRTLGADGTWSEPQPPGPKETPAVYDPVRQSMLIFGGQTQSGALVNDVWELALSGSPTWTLLETDGTKPSARSGHTLLFDSRRERLLLFGGVADGANLLNDVWSLDLTADPPVWAEGLTTGPTTPTGRAYVQAVYDSLNDQAVVFGGADGVVENQGPNSFASDLWVLPLEGSLAWEGSLVWAEVTPGGDSPSARAGGAVIYDEAGQRMVLFSGMGGAGVFDDCYELSLDASPTWAPLVTTGGPPSARAVSGVVYEAPQDRMVVYGGFDGVSQFGDVWALDLGASEWAELLPEGGPPSDRQFPAAVYDPPRDRMVIYGGNLMSGSTDVPDPLWSLSLGDLIEWTDLGGYRPPQRWDAAAAFDPTRGVMWIHGGGGWDAENAVEVTRSDLWTLPFGVSTDWSQPATSGTPPGERFGHSAVYDATRDRLVFFGGNDGTADLNEVWALTLSGTPEWSQLAPSGVPPTARVRASVVYDAVNDRMVVYGGSGDLGPQTDVWELAFSGESSAWSLLAPSGTPPTQRWDQSAALDRDANRLIIFGGVAEGVPCNEVHALTLTGSPVWSQLSPIDPSPAPRRGASMVSLGTRMLVFGGSTTGSVDPIADTWLLSLYPEPSWRQLDVGPLIPAARLAHSAVFDQASFRMAVFGGAGESLSGDDTWLLQMDVTTPTLTSLVSANAGLGRVDLVWEFAASAASAAIYRKAGDGPWTELGRVTPDGTGRIAYADLDVIAGSRYGYRLGWPEPAGEVFAGEVWVDVPQTLRFALRGMTPNPAPAGAGLVGFSLPDASPARLDLVDVAGRQVFSREVGSLGRGEHVVRVSGAQPLAPGLYLVRLTQGGRSLTAKVVAIR